MKNYLMPVTLALVVGFLSSKFMFNQYDYKQDVTSVFNRGEKIYFLQQGVYSSLDSMKESMKDVSYYIYSFVDNKYYTYVGITKSYENAEKLKGYFKSLGYDIYVKEFYENNSSFIAAVKNYDTLLYNTNDNEVISAILKEILLEYEKKEVNK